MSKRMKIRMLNKIICFFALITSILSCGSGKTILKSKVFNHICQCDSIYIEGYNFDFEDDSAVYSIMRKEPFKFQLYIDTEYVCVDNNNFHYLIGGVTLDTLGLINPSNNFYTYKKNIKGRDVRIFDFEIPVNECWDINADGYFKAYRVCLEKIQYNKELKDSVFSFSYNYLGQKFSNGYYFVNFDVSKRYGIVGYSFDNGINCTSPPVRRIE